MFDLCAPALIYVAFSLTQIVIDTYKGLYNTSLVKLIVMIMITILLNALCKLGLGFASWIIVFIPFIMMTIITSVLLYIFGLNATTGNLNTNNSIQSSCNINAYTNKNGDIVIYDPYYDEKNPVYYNSPNIIVPSPKGITQNTNNNLPVATNLTTFAFPSINNLFNTTSHEFKWV